jgi:hypothetical protein
MNILSSTAVALALLVAALAGPATAESPIHVDNARARATIGSGHTSAIYLTLRNAGAAADRLIGVASEVAKSTELHTTIHDQGIMKMRPLDGVDVPAGGIAEFTPGADHIMLIGLKAPLKAGDRFTLTLRFEKAGEVVADVAVVAPGDIQGTSHGMPQGAQ